MSKIGHPPKPDFQKDITKGPDFTFRGSFKTRQAIGPSWSLPSLVLNASTQESEPQSRLRIGSIGRLANHEA